MTAPVSPAPGAAGPDLMALADLPDPGAVSLTLGAGSARREVLVVRQGARVTAFVDACPHAFVPLGDGLTPLLDRYDPGLLVCSFHGARFDAGTGLCVSGPCRGKGLIPLAIEIRDGRIRLRHHV